MALPGRTTSAAVQAILLNDYDSTVPLDGGGNPIFDTWINIANNLVTKVIANWDPTYDSTDLELIERYLTAHFYAVGDPRTKTEGVSGVSATYEGNTDQFFASTRFGLAAMEVDYNGWLSRMSALMKDGRWRRRIGVLWVAGSPQGTPGTFNIFPSSALDNYRPW